MRIARGLAAVPLLLALAACDDPLSFRLDLISVSSASGGVNIRIAFTWGNRSDRTVYVDRCHARLERRTATGWAQEIDHTCSVTQPAVELAPGARWSDARFTDVVLPPGEYRAVFYVRTRPDAGAWQSVYSDIFRSTAR